MDLQQLQYFITCIEKGSLTKAAEELFTTQPRVSQVIRSMERELGVTPEALSLSASPLWKY